MKRAEIYTVPAGREPGYSWKWRECGGTITSAESFPMYYECLSDARSHGYEVELTHAQGNTSPGGAEFKLRGQQQSE